MNVISEHAQSRNPRDRPHPAVTGARKLAHRNPATYCITIWAIIVCMISIPLCAERAQAREKLRDHPQNIVAGIEPTAWNVWMDPK